jgi:hypothetical protein
VTLVGGSSAESRLERLCPAQYHPNELCVVPRDREHSHREHQQHLHPIPSNRQSVSSDRVPNEEDNVPGEDDGGDGERRGEDVEAGNEGDLGEERDEGVADEGVEVGAREGDPGRVDAEDGGNDENDDGP